MNCPQCYSQNSGLSTDSIIQFLQNSVIFLHNVVHNNIEDLHNFRASVTLLKHTDCNCAGHNKKRKVLGTDGEFNDITRSIVHQAKMKPLSNSSFLKIS